MDNIEQIKKRIQKENVPHRERKLLKFFNGFLIILLIAVGGLIYCKQDEDGALLKKLFNIDVSFKEMNDNIEKALDNIFLLNNQSDEDEMVSSQDLYHSVGNNNYTSDDNTIRMIRNGKISTISYQNEYQYFVVIEYDNNVQALYTLISNISLKIGDELTMNEVIGTYDGNYFNCIFKLNDEVISYSDALK